MRQNSNAFKNGTQDRATGWIKYGARWYNPTTGRFTQHDTLDAPLDPANANRYGHAANDPINNTDPLGLLSGAQIAVECAGGAGSSAGLAVALGTVTSGIGLVGSLAGGCASGVGTAFLAEVLADSAAQEAQYKGGFDYLGFLRDLNPVGRLIRQIG